MPPRLGDWPEFRQLCNKRVLENSAGCCGTPCTKKVALALLEIGLGALRNIVVHQLTGAAHVTALPGFRVEVRVLEIG
jgi:hypothetical protein